MADLEEAKARFPTIVTAFGPWLPQLLRLRDGGAECAYILDQLDEWPTYERDLSILERHLQRAVSECQNLERLIAEKRQLPSDWDEANEVILDKLAEVRAVYGLSRLGFRQIGFRSTPDLEAERDGKRYGIEITRLGASEGRRADVWDSQMEDPDGIRRSVMSQGGRVTPTLGEAIYRQIEQKYPQAKRIPGADGIVWVSLGRDYFAAGKYEQPGAGTASHLRRTLSEALGSAVQSVGSSSLFPRLRMVILSPGREEEDLTEEVPTIDAQDG